MTVRVADVYHRGVYWQQCAQHTEFSVAPYAFKKSFHATGAAAECARAALKYYAGPARPTVVRCIRIAEKFAVKKWVDPLAANTRRNKLRAKHIHGKIRVRKRAPTIYAVVAAQYAVESLIQISPAARLEAAGAAITAALWAGVSHDECSMIFAKWIIKDLIDNKRVSHSLRDAAIPAVIAGEYDIAKDILI